MRATAIEHVERYAPSVWASRLLPALERIAELPIERLIIPHAAVLEPDGAAHLRAAIAETRGG